MNLPAMIRFTTVALVSAIILTPSAFAEEEKEKVDYPETEIFLLDLNLDSTSMEISNAKNVTSRPGYDNQPYFTKDSSSFVFSRDDGYQTDIYEYNIKDQESVRLSQSSKTEFSPTPFANDRKLAFVSDRSNSIWFANRDNLDQPEWVFANNPIHEPIGYFSWNHDTGYIFILVSIRL